MRISGFASVLLAMLASGAGLEQGDRNYALSQLHATRKMFLDSLAGLSDAQWRFKPAPERWSIAEIAEHLVLTEDLLLGAVKKGLAQPANAPGRRGDRAQDEKLYAAWTDRSRKVSAPQPLIPTGRWAAPEAAAREFAARRGATLDFVRTTQDDLRGHTTKVAGADGDLYDLVLLIAAHVDRHVQQIHEVKAELKYPK